MMYQKIVVVGRLGKDPEARMTGAGKAVSSFSVAVSETWKDRSGDKQERTEWFNCVAFDRTAEIANKYLEKGSVTLVEGKMRTEKYTDKEGQERSSTKLYVDRLTLLPNSRADGERSQSSSAGQSSADFDDDIPF